MTKLLPIIIFSALLTCPTMAAANEIPTEDATLNVNSESVRVNLNGRTLHVQNGAGLTLEIYSVTGAKVASYKIDTNDKSIRLELPRGCYIVKVGDVARKVSIL
ncbi:MAG: T9SS type A sorting domain-containing protein [Bacteroidales bacterium]|nr:T9SS type A sorting domain-containing protein [Bacteroidales bacterium]